MICCKNIIDVTPLIYILRKKSVLINVQKKWDYFTNLKDLIPT